MTARRGPDPSDRVASARFIPGGHYYTARIAGFLVGLAVGGALGAVAGFAVGHYLDAVVRPLYSRAAPLRRSKDGALVAMFRLAGHGMRGTAIMPTGLEAEKVEFVCAALGVTRAQKLHAGRSLLHSMSLEGTPTPFDAEREVRRLGGDVALRRIAAELVLLFDPGWSVNTDEVLALLAVDPWEDLGFGDHSFCRDMVDDWRRYWNFALPLSERISRRRAYFRAWEAEDHDVLDVGEGEYRAWCRALGLEGAERLSRRQVQAAWRRTARRVHPDRHPPGEAAKWTGRMSAANAARDALLDRVPA